MVIIGTIITVLSFIFGIWQFFRTYNLKKYLKIEAMELYSDTGILLGNAQTCLKNLETNNINLAIQAAGKTEGMAQAIFKRSIKNIQHQFGFTRKDLDDWIKNKKIHDFHKDAFLTYAEK